MIQRPYLQSRRLPTAGKYDRPLPGIDYCSQHTSDHAIDNHLPPEYAAGYDNEGPEVPPKRSVNICLVCEEYLQRSQDAVKTDYGTIHLHCFRCCECDMSLQHSQFYFSNITQKIYCHLDFHQQFSPKCGYCSTPIETKSIFALEKYWHKGHFFCFDCSEPFGETDEYFVSGKDTLCRECNDRRQEVKCWKCGHSCVTAIEALGRQWCTSCFACEECTSTFHDLAFVLREDGTLVCNICETRRLKEECWSK